MSFDSFDDSQNLLYLCWNGHMKNILQVFLEQLSSENLVDVTVTCEGKFIKAHKMVLSACSPYFQEIFSVHNVPHPLIIMNDVRFTDLKQIIEFMYCGEIKVPEADFKNVLTLAQNLQVKGLSNVADICDEESVRSPIQPIISVNCDPYPVDLNCDTRKRKVDSKLSPDGSIRKKSRKYIPSKQSDLLEEDIINDIKIEPPDIEPSNETDLIEDKCSLKEKNDVQCNDKVNETETREILFTNLSNYSNDTGAENHLPKSSNSASQKSKSSTVNEYSSDNSSSNEFNKSNYSKRKKSSNTTSRIRRPPNAFMIFANEWRSKLSKIYDLENNNKISRRLGDMWKKLDKKEKDYYFRAAKVADIEHKEKYPGYYYSPQEARMRKQNRLFGKKEKSVLSEQCGEIRFAKVHLSLKKKLSIPVLIALDNPNAMSDIDDKLKDNEVKDELLKSAPKKTT